MDPCKEVLTSVLHTAQMGISGIEAVKNKAVKPQLLQLLQEQQKEYSMIESESFRLASCKGWDLPPRSKLLDKMSTISAKCRLMSGDTDSTIAGMLIQGNTRGMIIGIKHLNHTQELDQEVSQVAHKLLNLENTNIQKTQQFL